MRWKGSNYFQIMYFLALILFLLMNTIVVPYVSGDKKGERFYDSTFHPDFVHQVYSPDEILRGYKEPRINITLCATNLLVCLLTSLC